MRPTTVPPTPPAPTTAGAPPDTGPATPPADAPSAAITPIGVGIDTARYGHHATFLRPDLQAAAKPLDFTATAQGYAPFRQRLQAIAQRHGPVHCHGRLDAAGPYADNLRAFLYTLPDPKSISCGDTRRKQS
jgi:hypothetical protein